ncbi:MAG: cytochrome c biogenesis protein CcdA [Parabacteroides gordonii]|uniref:protein-disulfide reductase DsbD family protein n=1 Tax=Parabacteroides gordonii TaxID=574930 RepID=UPI003A8A7D91
MKKLFSIFLLVFVTLAVQAQIHQPVKWKIKLEDSKTAEKEIVFTATSEKGWHLYDMNLPEGGPVSTSFTFETLKGAELIGQPVSSVKPTVVYDELFAMDLRWYPGTVSFTQKVKITDPKKFKIEGEVEFMACNDETCLPPDRVSFTFDAKNTKLTLPSDAPAIDKEDVTAIQPDTEQVAQEAETLTTPDPVAKTDNIISSPAKIANELTDDAALWTPVIDNLKAFGDTTVTATDTSWLFIFFAGFLGGLIALLTPCVWPMIPMTVSFFLKRTKDRKKAIRDALTYGLSIIVIYLVMGLLITGIFGASALNDLSTNAIFNIIFFLLLVVFAISFFGAFEMVLPASWTTKLDSKADSTTGILSIFFMSFTLVLVSFSCTGPIIGTLLVQAASMGNAVGPAIGMFGFALALSIPFSLFAIFPNMLQSMPKSGGWLNSVKVVLGFLELALALKFLSVADLAYGWRLLDREVFIVLWIVIFILLGFYLLGKIKFSHDSDVKYVSVPRLFMAIISFGFAVYMVPGLWGAPLKSISAFAPPLYTQDFSLYDDEVHAAFDDYESGMAYAKRVNKPVMIDFSGFGCVNCRKMEASVWTDPKVKQLLEKDYVLITLMVDDKTKLPHPIEIEEHGKVRKLKTIGDKWSYLQRSKFGANAQPFYILLNDEGQPLGPSYAFNEDVSKYVQFLENGLKTFKEQSK